MNMCKDYLDCTLQIHLRGQVADCQQIDLSIWTVSGKQVGKSSTYLLLPDQRITLEGLRISVSVPDR